MAKWRLIIRRLDVSSHNDESDITRRVTSRVPARKYPLIKCFKNIHLKGLYSGIDPHSQPELVKHWGQRGYRTAASWLDARSLLDPTSSSVCVCVCVSVCVCVCVSTVSHTVNQWCWSLVNEPFPHADFFSEQTHEAHLWRFCGANEF